MTALEEIGEPYMERCVAIMIGEQRSREYLAVNPKGKVPVLVEKDVVITELPIILYHLAVACPIARLLPLDSNGSVKISGLSDIVWVAGTLHPTVARCFRPSKFSTSDPEGVKEKGMAELAGYATMISMRLSDDQWWYGENWSITDTFLAWIFSLAAQCDFPLHQYPALETHRLAVEQRASFVRARTIEQRIAKRDQIAMPAGFRL